MGKAHTGDFKGAQSDVDKLAATEKSLSEAGRAYAADDVHMLRQEAQAWLDHAQGNNQAAVATLRQVADQEDAEGPEQTAIPAREMLADMLLEMKQPGDALSEYETSLRFNPGRFNGLYGAARAAEMDGKREQANTYYSQLLKNCDGSGSQRPELNQARALIASK